MVHIICTKNDSIWDIVPDGRSGRTDALTTQKYIPLTSSVDNKQAKSNGNIDKQFIENQNNWIIMPSIIAWNKVFIIWNRSDAIYAKCNKKSMPTINA